MLRSAWGAATSDGRGPDLVSLLNPRKPIIDACRAGTLVTTTHYVRLRDRKRRRPGRSSYIRLRLYSGTRSRRRDRARALRALDTTRRSAVSLQAERSPSKSFVKEDRSPGLWSDGCQGAQERSLARVHRRACARPDEGSAHEEGAGPVQSQSAPAASSQLRRQRAQVTFHSAPSRTSTRSKL